MEKLKILLTTLFKKHQIQNISYDSRSIRPHSAFFAIKGAEFDGNVFISDVLAKGAIIFTDDAEQKGKSLRKIFYVESARMALAVAAGILYSKFPPNLAAITGTNGKSSVVSYIYQILKLLGRNAASVGTLGLNSTIELEDFFLNNISAFLTTPDPVFFRKVLHKLAKIGVDNFAFEASSHGICQKRLGDIKVKTAGFTSFSQDHLDYHGTMKDYLKAKLQLFVDNLEAGGEVVINAEILEDNKYSLFIQGFLQEQNINYCVIGENGNVKVTNIYTSLKGQHISFVYKNKSYEFKTDIIGSFQAVNLLVAAKVAANLGVDFNLAVKALAKIKSVTGRLDRVGDVEDEYQIFVDYAHTPHALESSLTELKKIKAESGKLYLLFGCGGKRDKSKRPIMGKIAAKLADYVVVTDDNPRCEDPGKIRFDILKEILPNRATNSFIEEIAGRERAIKNTIAKLQENDILLIAGKGHEEYQIIGNEKLFFSDIKIVQKMLEKKQNKMK